ncbi:MAG: tRNA-binding protein [Mucilaginibacter sp.]|nr:tRNA-binding protein [Mucilaginibacter sp.]
MWVFTRCDLCFFVKLKSWEHHIQNIYHLYLCHMETITWNDFEKVELRAGTILEVADFPEARKPAYKLKVDFGPYGIRQSSAQITKHYTREELPGKQILGVINFPKKQIANFMSEFLVTGLADESGDIVLTIIDRPVPNGSKLI